MGIKHSVAKASGESGYAIEWNADHIIDGDIDFGGFNLYNVDYAQLGDVEVSGTLDMFNAPINMNAHQIINLAEPLNLSDAATKNYVDGQAGGIPSAIATYANRSFTRIDAADNWGDNTASDIYVGVSTGQKVLIMSSGTLRVGTDDWIQIRLARNSVGFTHPRAELDDDAGQGADVPYSLCYLDVPGSGTFKYGIQSNYNGIADIEMGYILAIVFN